jgi:hypothetical protein
MARSTQKMSTKIFKNGGQGYEENFYFHSIECPKAAEIAFPVY